MGNVRKLITLVEVPPFGRKASACMTEAEIDDLKLFVAMNPEAGAKLRGSGGLRKVRWATGAKGKRGGVRVIYFYYDDSIPLFLMTVYPKADKASLSAKELAELRRLAEMIVNTYKGGSDD